MNKRLSGLALIAAVSALTWFVGCSSPDPAVRASKCEESGGRYYAERCVSKDQSKSSEAYLLELFQDDDLVALEALSTDRRATIEHLENTISWDSDDTFLLNALAVLYALEGHLAEADQLLSRALSVAEETEYEVSKLAFHWLEFGLPSKLLQKASLSNGSDEEQSVPDGEFTGHAALHFLWPEGPPTYYVDGFERNEVMALRTRGGRRGWTILGPIRPIIGVIIEPQLREQTIVIRVNRNVATEPAKPYLVANLKALRVAQRALAGEAE